jgi:hypothetical protein
MAESMSPRALADAISDMRLEFIAFLPVSAPAKLRGVEGQVSFSENSRLGYSFRTTRGRRDFG